MTVYINGVAVRLSKTKRESRDMTAVAGDVSYTGYGFKPSCLIASGMVGTIKTACWGVCDANKYTQCAYQDADGNGAAKTNYLLYLETAAVTRQKASVASLDADGFTLTWAKDGDPAALTAWIPVLALR